MTTVHVHEHPQEDDLPLLPLRKPIQLISLLYALQSFQEADFYNCSKSNPHLTYSSPCHCNLLQRIESSDGM